jgi:phosphoribosylanthranilate isomerase
VTSPLVKICGVKTPEQAVLCVAAGAASIGVNFVASSARRVDVATARAISRAVGKTALVVGVVADMKVDEMRRLRDDAELGCLQLHGDESPEDVAALLPHAYKSIHVGDEGDIEHARTFPGDYILVDAKVDGALGGTGKTFDWTLVRALATEKKLTLAGGLTADNVGRAVLLVVPYCVDVASGVEAGTPGVKDLGRVAAFIRAAQIRSTTPAR